MSGWARQYFCEARDAARALAEHDARREREAAKCGIRARREGRCARGGTPDPMRHADAVVDLDAERPTVARESERALSEAYEVAGGIGHFFGDEYAEVVARRFLWCESWDEVARQMGVTRTEAERTCDVALDMADSEGLARLRDWRGEERRTGAEWL